MATLPVAYVKKTIQNCFWCVLTNSCWQWHTANIISVISAILASTVFGVVVAHFWLSAGSFTFCTLAINRPSTVAITQTGTITFMPMLALLYWAIIGCVRLAPLGRPGAWRFFLPGRTWVIICTHLSWNKKPPHTGVNPGKLNERTPFVTHIIILYKALSVTIIFSAPW